MKTFDCFLFFNELDLLEIRFNILNDFVDYFVIVEASQTFQGENKEFIFEKNKKRFAKYEHKIIHFKINQSTLNFTDLPYIKGPITQDDKILNGIFKYLDDCPHFDKKTEFWWGNDFFQRECIWRALAKANPKDNDLILISDVDEIPSVETIVKIKKEINPNSLFCLLQHEFCYYLNYYHNSNWLGTCCFLYGKYSNASLNAIRFAAKREEGFAPEILKNGGWHFTSLGGVEAIKLKISSWGHREYNNNLFLKSVEYNVKHGYDIFRRPGFGRLTFLNTDDLLLPSILNDLREKYYFLIGPRIIKENLFSLLFYRFYFKLSFRLRRLFDH